MKIERLPLCQACWTNRYTPPWPGGRGQPDDCCACGDNGPCVLVAASVSEDQQVRLPFDEGIRGINRRSLANQYRPDGGRDERSTVTVVLACGHPTVGDYAAYAAIGDPDFVRAYGAKLRFAEACGHFPEQLERERYRED